MAPEQSQPPLPCPVLDEPQGDLRRLRRVRIGILVLVGLLYVAGVGPKWWPTKDSALYLTLARNLAEGHGYVVDGQPCNFGSPGLPWLLAPVYAAFGENFLLMNAVMAAIGIASVLLIDAALRQVTDWRTALATTVVTALSYRFYLAGHQILTDMPFTLAFWMALYAALRLLRGHAAWLTLVAAASAAGAFLRAPGLLLLAALGLGVAFAGRGALRRQWIAAGTIVLAGAAAVAMQWFWARQMVPDRPAGYTPQAAPGFSATYVLTQFGIGGRNLLEVLAETLTGQEMTWSVGLAAAGLWVAGLVRQWRRGWRLAALATVAYPILLVLVTGGWAIRSRYFIEPLPLYVLGVLDGLAWLAGSLARRPGASPSRAAAGAVLVLAIASVAISLGKVGRWVAYYTPVSYTDRYYDAIREPEHKEAFEVAAILRPLPPSECIATTAGNARVLHFLSRKVILTAGPQGEDRPTSAEEARETVARLAETGCSVLIVDQRDGSKAYTQAVLEAVAALTRDASWRRAYAGRVYQVYVRTQGGRSPP